MKKLIILGICAMPFFFASCGGSEADAEGTDTDSTAVVEEEVETIMATYNVDTENTVINWNNFMGGEADHMGTVKALSGSFDLTSTGDVHEITNASLVVDMNSISEGSEKLEGHLKNEDFFDVNQFATTEFTFDRHENDMIYGTATIVGKEVAVEAPVTIGSDEAGATVEVGEFKIDFTALEMPFFIADVEQPEEEQHDPNIAFTASIVGTK